MVFTTFIVFCCLGVAYSVCSEAIVIWVKYLYVVYWMSVIMVFKFVWVGLLVGCLYMFMGLDYLVVFTLLIVGSSRA